MNFFEQQFAQIVSDALDDEIERQAKERVDAKQKEIDDLRISAKVQRGIIATQHGDLNIAKLQLASTRGMIDDYAQRCVEQENEIAWLKRPLWLKIVGWFAR